MKLRTSHTLFPVVIVAAVAHQVLSGSVLSKDPTQTENRPKTRFTAGETTLESVPQIMAIFAWNIYSGRVSYLLETSEAP